VKPGILLDANVLIAMAWPSHTDHTKVQRWLAASLDEGWATCPVTESAFVRIISNPAFSPDGLTPKEANDLLRENLKHSAHRFWADEIALDQALQPVGSRIEGHNQMTDAYLLGLAMHKKSKLATLDQGLRGLLDPSSQRDFLIFI
jgi:uncharacterized protein